MKPTRILIISDELAVVQGCTRVFRRAGLDIVSALSPTEAFRYMDDPDFDVVFIDLKHARDKGYELLERLRQISPETAVVVFIGRALVVAAANAMRFSDYQYLPKPFSSDDLTAALGRALQQRTLLLEANRLRDQQSEIEFEELVGTGPAMRGLFRSIAQVAPTGDCVLIIGEAGSGKEIAARAVHQASPRKHEPFVVTELNPLSDISMTDQIFGYTTSSKRNTTSVEGLVDGCEKGTLYIDEIAEIDNVTLYRLVTAIEERQFIPTGSRQPRPLTCRVIMATATNLHNDIESGRFPEVFSHQFSVYPIYLPSLSERTEDIPALTYHLLQRFNLRYGKEVSRVDERLMTRLIARRWPNNVRELASSIERMVRISDGDLIDLEHYQEVMEEGSLSQLYERIPATAEELIVIKKQLRQRAVAEIERLFITSALQRCGGNVTKAAQDVGMQRRNFQTLMRQHGVKSG